MMAPAAAASTSITGMRPDLAVIDRCWALPFLTASSTFLFSMPQIASGILYVFFMDKFGVSREGALWPRTVESVTANIMGFVIGAVQRKLSVYNMIVTGALLCPIALVSSAFVPNIAWMTVTIGFLYGISQGLQVIATSIYVVSFFEDYRGVAIGIKSAGFSLAGIVGASLLPYLQSTYGVDGALMLIGGLMLNLLPLALMIRNPRPCGQCLFQASKSTGDQEKQADATNYGTCKVAQANHRPSNVRLPAGDNGDSLRNCVCQEEDTSSNRNVDIRLHTELPDVEPSSPTPPSSGRNESSDGVVVEILRLLQAPCFYILLASLVSCEFTSQMFSATIVDYAGDKGVSVKKGAQLSACSSAGSICGQLFVPLLAAKLTHSRCTPAVVSFLVLSLSFFLMPFFVDFVAIGVITVLSGIQHGYLRTLKPVLVADYLGAHNIAISWGTIGLLCLPLALCEPSIVGVFRDTGGSYDNLYRTCGAVDLIAALVLSVQACLDARKRRRGKITSPNS